MDASGSARELWHSPLRLEAWTAKHPGAGPLIVAGTDDDAWQSYLSVKTQRAADFVGHYLWTHTATGNTVSGGSRTLAHSGPQEDLPPEGQRRVSSARRRSHPRHPDVWGASPGRRRVHRRQGEDRRAWGRQPGRPRRPDRRLRPGRRGPQVSDRWVETTQIAPTILRLLGLDPESLDAVRIEGTRVLPGP